MIEGLNFIHLTFGGALEVVLLGFIGGLLSGFIGSGGAFFMTPGMMNLGVPGVVAVGTNISHKLGKALMGSMKHRELGHVDRKLGFYMLITAFIGIRIAVWLNTTFFKMGGGEHGEGGGSAAGDLYISGIFVVILSIISISILRDALKTRASGEGPSTKLAEFFSRLNIPPIINFPVADVRVSLWIVALVIVFCSCEENPGDAQNSIPEIIFITADSDTLIASDTVRLSCNAIDADGDLLTYWWSSDYGSFTDGVIGQSVFWKAPRLIGIYPVMAYVSDGKEIVNDSINIIVHVYPAQEGRDFADQHFDEWMYRVAEFSLARSDGIGDACSFQGTLDEWNDLPWEQKIRYLPREGFDLDLPNQSNREVSDSFDIVYYEIIGYFISQFGFGWDDGYGDVPGTLCFDGRSPNCEFYVETWLRPR